MRYKKSEDNQAETTDGGSSSDAETNSAREQEAMVRKESIITKKGVNAIKSYTITVKVTHASHLDEDAAREVPEGTTGRWHN